MVWTVIRHEWRHARIAFISWTGLTAVLVSLAMAFYPRVAASAGEVVLLLEQFPQELLGLLSLNSVTLAQPMGYFSANAFLFVHLLGNLYSAANGARILHADSGQGGPEYIMSQPIGRTQVLRGKILVFIGLTVVYVLVNFLLSVALFLLLVRQVWSLVELVYLFTYGLLVMLVFGGLGMFFSLFFVKSRTVAGPVIGFVIVSYMLAAFSRIAGPYAYVAYVSPVTFAWFNVANPGYGLVWWRIAYFLLMIAVPIGASMYIYKNRDMAA